MLPRGCVGHSLLRGFPGEIWNWPPYTEGKERPKKKAERHTLVVGGFNKQGNFLLRLVLGCHTACGSPRPPARILNVYGEALTGFSHVHSPGSLNTTITVSKLCPWVASNSGRASRTYIPKIGEGVSSLQMPESSSQVKLAITSSWWPSPAEAENEGLQAEACQADIVGEDGTPGL